MWRPAILNALALLTMTTATDASQRVAIIDRHPAADALEHVRNACAKTDTQTCREAKEILAHQAATDLMILASTRNRQFREIARQAADVPFPQVRAAAAATLGALSPDRSDTDTLRRLLNDPVPGVRHPALRALGRSTDAAKRALLERVKSAGHKLDPEDLRPDGDAIPDTKQLGGPIYTGATFIHFASNLASGMAAFVTDDDVDAVLRFYTQKASRPAMSADELERILAMAPTMSRQDTAKTMAQVQELQRRMEELRKSGKSQQEIFAEMQKEMRTLSTPTAGPTPAAITRPYRRNDLYGSPRFVLLSKPEDGTAALRYAVVFQDVALGKTGFVLHVPPQR